MLGPFARGRIVDALVGLIAASTLALAGTLTAAGEAVAFPGGGTLGPMCWLHEAFGVACPFCGMTRSIVALLDGDVGPAFRFHPAGLLVAGWLLVAAVWMIAAAVGRRRPVSGRPAFVTSLRVVAVAAVAAGAARWLPMWGA